MAFKASNVLPADAYDEARQRAVGVKTYSTSLRDQMAAGNISADQTLNLLESLKSYRDKLNTAASTPGIVIYAQEQENDVGYDVAAEFTALTAAIQAAIDDIIATFPSSTFHSFVGEVQTYSEFTPAQTVTLRGLLDNIIAAVE